MKTSFTLVFLTAAALSHAQSFRPPAVPLIAHDPYFSIWSMADRLTDQPTKHWTGTEQPLTSLVRIDGHTYRIMGRDPRNVDPLPQTGLDVLPTRTIYRFEGAGVHVDLTFLTPALPKDLDVLSRPVTYVVWNARSTEARPHEVEVYFDASPMLAVNTPEQRVEWSRLRVGDMNAMRLGSQQQPVLEKEGDNLRIDWGYLYVAAPGGTPASEAAASLPALRSAFGSTGAIPEADDTDTNRPANSRGV
ncbi:MAG: DUF5127 domain-containing protein, partial [Acidobacteriota bacterium]|nr:DUF5127 domain-containing protein [Acidobacteriota bacterium]